jgi:hypothetical protein
VREPSWRVKLLRAEHHFGHFKLRIGSLPPEIYAVRKRFETYEGAQQWVWWADIPIADAPELSAIVGDVLFNVRSALDHLAVALIPPERRTRHVLRRAQFPIFTCDIDERDPITGAYLHGNQRGNWDRQTQGLTKEALVAVKWHQPYNFASQGLDPRDSSLTVLSALQNADKHRQLVVFTRGIRDPTGHWTDQGGNRTSLEFPAIDGGFIGDGTMLDHDPADVYGDVKMEIEGTPEIFIGESWHGPYREATSSLRLIISNGWLCVERLEPLVHDAPP